ncbi:BadF/BadG/BcrA/BcrD ATPase family protein [Streptomyces sp. NPDC003697]
MTAAVAVDLGRTGCRAVLCGDRAGPAPEVHEVPGAPGPPAGDGVAAARAAVRAAVLPLLAREPSFRPAALCVGAAGLRAVLRAHDGRGPGSALPAAAVDRFGDPGRLPSALTRDGNPARTAASFAPDVARAAAAGGAAASEIVRDAATALGEAVLAAARRIGGDTHRVTVTGGLAALGEPLLGPLRAALAGAPRPLRLRPPLGDLLDGARLLAPDAPAPHEPQVARVRRTTPLPTVPTPPAAPPAAD